MQVTTQVEGKSIDWLNYAVICLGIVVGFLLFGLVIGRMGLLNGLFSGAGATAVSPGALLYPSENMRFGQEVLVVKAGENITLELDNRDMYAHSFDIDELDLHVEMPANDQIATQLTAVSPGTYTIYCAIPGHREAGMVATLVVED